MIGCSLGELAVIPHKCLMSAVLEPSHTTIQATKKAIIIVSLTRKLLAKCNLINLHNFRQSHCDDSVLRQAIRRQFRISDNDNDLRVKRLNDDRRLDDHDEPRPTPIESQKASTQAADRRFRHSKSGLSWSQQLTEHGSKGKR